MPRLIQRKEEKKRERREEPIFNAGPEVGFSLPQLHFKEDQESEYQPRIGKSASFFQSRRSVQ